MKLNVAFREACEEQIKIIKANHEQIMRVAAECHVTLNGEKASVIAPDYDAGRLQWQVESESQTVIFPARIISRVLGKKVGRGQFFARELRRISCC